MWAGKKRFFLSFVEEAVQNPLYAGYIGGRVEVTGPGDDYPREEIRFFVKDHLSEYYRLRDTWDFKEITATQLDKLRKDLGGLK